MFIKNAIIITLKMFIKNAIIITFKMFIKNVIIILFYYYLNRPHAWPKWGPWGGGASFYPPNW